MDIPSVSVSPLLINVKYFINLVLNTARVSHTVTALVQLVRIDRYGLRKRWWPVQGIRYKFSLELFTMQTSTAVIALGVLLFVVPLPGTFILDGAVALFGAFLRWFGV
jgi:hypothetical protein